MKREDIYVGQTLELSHGKVGGSVIVKVIKKNPKNIKVRTESGTVWNAHPSFLEKTIKTFSEIVLKYELGTLVKLRKGTKTLFVVGSIDKNSSYPYTLVKLGGSSFPVCATQDEIEIVNFSTENIP